MRSRAVPEKIDNSNALKRGLASVATCIRQNANVSERNIAIERGELIAHGGGKGGGIREAGARYDKDEVNRNLRGRDMPHFRREIFLERNMFHVPDNADYLAHPGLVIADAPARLDAFADHILPRKKFLDEASFTIATGQESNFLSFLENSALQERDAHCWK